jgi:hypothetical protein
MNDDPTCDLTPAAEPAAPSPGINVKLLAKGTVLLLEGETDIYELTMLYPEHGIAEVTSNHSALRATTIGQFMHSIQWNQPGIRLNAIRQGWTVVLRFSNGQFQTQPIASACVRGTRGDGSHWHYDVF